MSGIFAIYNVDEGSYTLTTAGYTAIIILLLVLLIAGSSIRGFLGKKRENSVRKLVFSAIAVALATVAGIIPMFKMPMGGHITLCSLFIIALIGYWYGLGTGLTCAIAYGLVQLTLDPYIISLPQLFCDYIFAFGALGLSGLFSSRRVQSPAPGYIVAVLGRYFFAVMSGVIFFAAYAPSEGILSNPWLYSLTYNIIYIGAEAVITLVIINIPAVRTALNAVSNIATGGEYKRYVKADEITE